MVWHLKQYLRRKLWSRVWRGVVGRKNAGWSIVWATFRNEIAYHLGKWEISTDSDYHCSSNFYCSGLTLSHLKVIKTLFSPSIMKTLLSWWVRRITTPNSENNMKKNNPSHRPISSVQNKMASNGVMSAKLLQMMSPL